MKRVMIVSLLLQSLYADEYKAVKITPELSYVYVYHKGKAINIHRIQDTSNKISGEYAKQYHRGSVIQPINIGDNIRTIAEVELLDFMQNKGNTGEGIVIDVREKTEYNKETIPSAKVIPFTLLQDTMKMEKILQIFGAKRGKDGKLNTNEALDLVVFSGGSWSSKAKEFIEALVAMGYDSHKILYYRGGFQMWKMLGLTTISNKEKVNR